MQATPRGKPRRRISLSSYKTEILRWVGEGKTDEWIAYALGTSRSSVQSFRSRSGIYRINRAASEDADEQVQDSPSEASIYEGVLEHGEPDGYGLWLDPSVADDPVFQKGFAKVSDVNVRVEERIVLEPALTEDDGSAHSGPVTFDVASGLETVFGSNGVSASSEGGAPTSKEEQGEVKWFEEAKGYGFIYRPNGSEIFVHRSEIKGSDTLAEKSEVRYEVGSNQRGLVAKEVRTVA